MMTRRSGSLFFVTKLLVGFLAGKSLKSNKTISLISIAAISCAFLCGLSLFSW